MKKLIVVIMALITIFSASVSAYASSGSTFVDWQIVDTILNLEYSSTNCKVIFFNSDTPNVDWTDVMGRQKFQKTTYSVLLDMYETLTVYGASLSANVIFPQVYDWFEYNGHCFIRITVENNITGSVNDKFWVGNGSGKILYCDAPPEETTYTISAIAGTSNYFLTDRPAGTSGNGYLGDLQVTYDNWMNIKNILDSLSGNRFYYAYGHSINGEYRYYLTGSGFSQTYYVCNSAGQLFYYVKDEGSTTPPDGGGSTFDPTEVITAINSVYDAITAQGNRVVNSITQLITFANSIGNTLNMHMNNVVDGFVNLQNNFSTLNGYFSDLSGLFPVQEEITLLGSDTRVAWDSADRITNVSTSGFNIGDLTVKTNPGPLINESGYQNVKLSPDTTEYTLSTVDGYRRITADNEYPDTGAAVPDDTLFYCSFDNDSVSSSVGDLQFSVSNGSASYAVGISGNAFVFNGSNYIYSSTSSFPALNQPFTLSFWVYVTSIPPNVSMVYRVGGYNMYLEASIRYNGRIGYTISTDKTTYQGSTENAIKVNSWNNIALTFDGSTGYGFVNGVLDVTFSASTLGSSNSYFYIGTNNSYFPLGSMVDEVIFVNGSALWTSSFNAEEEAVFSAVAADYFLPCTDQTIGLVFDDTINKTLSPTDVNGNAITMGRLEDDFSEIYIDISTMQWYCHDPQTQTEILLSSSNQQIMNDTIYVLQNYTTIPADQITADSLQNLLPVDSPVYLDMPEGAKLTITYDHYAGWFRMMYILMDKQTKLLSDLDIVNETIINVENTVVDITNNNPAYNVFYITKTDGTTESVGDAAKDAAVFVGDILSMFYRLVFDDALDNTGIISDFESTLTSTNSGVDVW